MLGGNDVMKMVFIVLCPRPKQLHIRARFEMLRQKSLLFFTTKDGGVANLSLQSIWNSHVLSRGFQSP